MQFFFFIQKHCDVPMLPTAKNYFKYRYGRVRANVGVWVECIDVCNFEYERNPLCVDFVNIQAFVCNFTNVCVYFF